MAPTLVASRTALPPEGALRLRPGEAGSAALAGGRPRGFMSCASLTLVASHPLLPPEGALRLRPGEAGSAALAGSTPPISTPLTSQPLRPPARIRGFTLIELLVALAAMALMAGLSWRGLDGMVRAQSQIAQRADAVLTLQAGLSQWSADLDALLQLPNTQTLDWDGRGLRIVRRSTMRLGDGALVVAWTRRNINGTDYWLRWQSAPQFSRGELKTAWAQAAQWAQNPGEAEKREEVRITPLAQWQIFYFRGNAWTNPLSSDNATTPPPSPSSSPSLSPSAGTSPAPAVNQILPDGVRLVLTLPAGEAISGVLTHDWARPALGGAKS